MPSYKENSGPKYRQETFIPKELDDAGLSQKAFRVYCHLCRRADKHGRAWPTIERIRKHYRGKRMTIIEAIRELKARGFLEIIRKKPVRYQLTGIQKWKTANSEPRVHSDSEPPVHSDSEPTHDAGQPPERPETSEGTPNKGTPNKVPQRIHTPAGAGTPVHLPPTLEEIKEHCLKLALPESDADYFNDLWQGNGFTLNKVPIHEWRAVIENRKRRGWCPSQRPAAQKKAQSGSIRTRVI
jgi:hypothetical protein